MKANMKIPWKYFFTFYGVVRSLPGGLRGLAVRRLPRMQEVVGSNPTEGKICFSHFTLLEWNVKKCFVLYEYIELYWMSAYSYYIGNFDTVLLLYVQYNTLLVYETKS